MGAPDRVRPVQWLSVHEAASILGIPAITLRRSIERHARRTSDGSVEAQFDGVVARKIGRRWRVHLGSSWFVTQGAIRSA